MGLALFSHFFFNLHLTVTPLSLPPGFCLVFSPCLSAQFHLFLPRKGVVHLELKNTANALPLDSITSALSHVCIGDGSDLFARCIFLLVPDDEPRYLLASVCVCGRRRTS